MSTLYGHVKTTPCFCFFSGWRSIVRIFQEITYVEWLSLKECASCQGPCLYVEVTGPFLFVQAWFYFISSAAISTNIHPSCHNGQFGKYSQLHEQTIFFSFRVVYICLVSTDAIVRSELISNHSAIGQHSLGLSLYLSQSQFTVS